MMRTLAFLAAVSILLKASKVSAQLTIDVSQDVDGGVLAVNGALTIDGPDPGPVLRLLNGATADGVALLTVGDNEYGGLEVLQGSRLSPPGFDVRIGRSSDASGNVLISGVESRLDSSFMIVGYGGQGNLAIMDRGLATSSIGVIGHDSTASGAAVVSGDGSSWTLSAELAVGLHGGGTLLVADGGRVESGSGGVGAGTVSDKSGQATVSGENSRWSVDGVLQVGTGGGRGILNVLDGGLVETGADIPTGLSIVLGAGANSHGSAVVSAGGALIAEGNLWVGSDGGVGELEVLAGGTVQSDCGVVGSTGVGDVAVAGPGAAWTIADSLEVGRRSGVGSLRVLDGGRVENGFAMVGGAGGVGSVIVSGDDSAWTTTSTLDIWYNGEVRALDGGMVECHWSVRVFDGGTVHVGQGGKVVAEVVVLWGTLTGSGQVDGLLYYWGGGVIAPGESVGRLTVAGDVFWESGGRFHLELQDAATGNGWDVLEVDGAIHLAALPGSLLVDLISLGPDGGAGLAANFDETQDYAWTFARASDGIFGFSPDLFVVTTDRFANPVLGTFSVRQSGQELQLVYTPVPELSTLSLLVAAGLAALALAKKKIGVRRLFSRWVLTNPPPKRLAGTPKRPAQLMRSVLCR